GSKVTLEILPKGIGPEGPSKTIELVRNKINLEQQAAKSSTIKTDSGNKIGIISLAAFYMDFAAHSRGDKDYRSTTRDVRKLINELQSDEVNGIVIDLRGNGGGSLNEALELTGLFIEAGPIVQTKDVSGHVEINHDPDSELLYAGPLAVLVDRNSASASEIFAGAIQDYRRGIIIGEPTFGKGTVQNIVDLNRFDTSSDEDLGKLKTTIAQFFRVSGGSNQYRGVVPDILYPIAESAEEYGERAYANALPWDSVEPARYQPAHAPIDKFDQARKAHKARIAKDQAFTSYVKRNEFIQDARNRNTVSLNIEQRKAERDKLVSQHEDLDDEYKSALADVIGSDDDDSGNTEREDNKPDILLKEAARILDDLILPDQLHAGQEEKKRSPSRL
ncbi:MAG: carboxy terminal-processing peptidase, partial [Gammaproteobacteria bacterium]